jgi:hypothetical protein
MFILYFLIIFFAFKGLVYFINNKTSNDFDYIAKPLNAKYNSIKSYTLKNYSKYKNNKD